MDKRKKRIIIISLLVLSFIFVCILSLTIYLYTGRYKSNIDSNMLKSDELITVKKDDDYISFIPKEYSNGLIFYQGAKVDEKAYIPMMRKIASEGILCVIAKMPFDIAIFDADAAEDIIDDFNDNIRWYISGHSLGGVIASAYAADNKNEIDGVILFASYSTKDISDLRVLSIYGSNDKILNKKKYENSKKNYPSDFTELVIEGGNHANFGYYGKQKGDGETSISREDQIDISVDAIINFIK